MRNLLIVIALLPLFASAAPKQEYYSLRIYSLKTADQEARIDTYLQTALLPALHKLGIPEVGVFKALDNDTAAVRHVYVLIPFKSVEQWLDMDKTLARDPQYASVGRDYIEATYDNPAYSRMESIFLLAFPDMPHHAIPTALQGPHAERIYELRSYEGPTEKYFANKVQMFNEGGEIPLFQRLGFNAVFYASVISGPHMPNLMYMTSFDNMPSREQHWKDFSADPVWKQLVASPQYQHNVSHVDIIFLHPATYSDL